MAMLAGFSRVRISPGSGTRLFGAPPPGPEGNRVGDHLHACAAYLEAGSRAGVVSLDALWVTSEMTQELRRRAAERFGIKPENFLLAATHTHAAPQVRPGTGDGYPEDREYAGLLLDWAEEALAQAVAAARPARLTARRGPCRGVVVRRRAILDLEALRRGRLRRTVANRPDFSAPLDATGTAVWVTAEDDGSPLGVLLNIPCHPTVGDGRAVSADYPGALARELARRRGSGLVTVFLQGFSGDLRPALVRRPSLAEDGPLVWLYRRLFDPLLFRRGNPPEVVEAFARGLADDVESWTEERGVRPDSAGRTADLALPLEDGSAAEVAVQGLRLGPGLCLLAAGAEVFSSHARWLRSRLEPSCWVVPVGCAGGMAGYLPDVAALAQGGYETDRSLGLFGLPARFAPEAETSFRNGLVELASGCSGRGEGAP
ncbi:MAG: hypothetical protein AB1916_05090 [Thermodesulfobacteriota bacterium]